jgi:phosphate/sulfate permease
MPTRTAFLLAFVSVVVAGLFGGIIGYGLADVGCTGDCQGEKFVGTLLGSLIAAGGVGIVAVLVLRAMAEWRVKTQRG